MDPLPATEVERLWILRNVFLLLDVEFCYSFINGILSELSLGKANEFIDNLVLSLGDKAVSFFTSILRVEMQHATSATELTKHTSVSGKFLSSFLQLHSQDYFKKVLTAPINDICKSVSEDDSKVGSEQEVQSVIDGFTDLMDPMFNSEQQCPAEIKSILKVLQEIVDSRFREGLKMVGFFFFERGWCPAIALPKMLFADLDISSGVFRRLQLLSKLFTDLVRRRYDKGPFASVLAQSDTSLIEFLAVICSNSDKGIRAIGTTRTPQQVLATKNFIDIFPLLPKPLYEKNLRKLHAADTRKILVLHCLHMFGLFKEVAVDVGLQQNATNATIRKAANSKTMSKRDFQKRESLLKAIKNADYKEYASIANSSEGRSYLDNPTEEGSYPLILACASKASAIVKHLVLTAKVNVNVVDNNSMTPILFACKTANEDNISHLLSARPGADTSIANADGFTALHFLIQTMPQYDALLLAVLDRGVDINATTKPGDSILTLAVRSRCSYDVIHTIVDRGANISHQDSSGRTALYWAQEIEYEPVQKLLLSKGAQDLGGVAKRKSQDSCTCSGGLTVSYGGTCAACGKIRCRDPVGFDKATTAGFAKPWQADQIKTEMSGRTQEQRCATLGKPVLSVYEFTFHLGDTTHTLDAKAPSNAMVKSILRRCQADTMNLYQWERGAVYNLTIMGGEADDKKEIVLDYEHPLWLYDLDEHTDIYIKPAASESKKQQFYLKFLLPQTNKPVISPINPFQNPRSLLTTTLTSHLAPFASEIHRLGLFQHTDTGTFLLNDQQPISTLNLICWDIISVKIRDAYEFEVVDDPTKSILVERNLQVSRVLDILSRWLQLGSPSSKAEELTAPLSQDIQNAFNAEGLTIPAYLRETVSLSNSSELPRKSSGSIFKLSKLRSSNALIVKPEDTNNADWRRVNSHGSPWNNAAVPAGKQQEVPNDDTTQRPPLSPGRSAAISINTTAPTLSLSSSATLPMNGTPNGTPMGTPSSAPGTPTFTHQSDNTTPPATPTSTPPSSTTPPAANPPAVANQPPAQAPNSPAPAPAVSSYFSPLQASSSFASAIASTITSTITSPFTGSRMKTSPGNSTAPSPSSSTLLAPPEPSAYVKQTIRGFIKVVRNVPMWLSDNTPLTAYNIATNDILEICDRTVIYPRDGPNEKFTLVLPPTTIKLRVKWAAEDPHAAKQSPQMREGNISSFALKADPQLLMNVNTLSTCVRNEAKLVFVGTSGGGKTTLIRQLERLRSLNDKDPLRDATKIKEDHYMRSDITGVVRSEWKFSDSDSKYMYRTYELVGQEEFLFSQQFLITPGCIFVIVFDLLKTRDDAIQNWLETIQTRAKDSAVIIVGTRSETKEAAKKVNTVLDSMARRFCKYENIAGFTAVSSKTFKGVRQFAQLLLRVSREKGYVDTKIPVSHVVLSKIFSLSRVEAHKAYSPAYITWEHTKAIGDRLGLVDKQLKEAVKFSMDISEIIYFGFDSSSPLADLVFLGNQWLPALMNSAITYKDADNEGIVTHSELCKIWKSPFFPPHMHNSLIELLAKFEMLFAQDDSHYLIPLLLDDAKPAKVKDLIPPFEPAGGTQNERIFEFGPMAVGFFSRLIARLLGTFSCLVYWKYGVVLTPQELIDGNANSRAILEYIPSTYRLRMSVRNDKNGKLLRPLADSIMTFITTWFPGRLQHVMIVCAHCIANQSYDPFVFDLDACESAAAQGKQYVMCRGVHPVRIDLLALDVTLNDQSTIPYDQITLGDQLGEGSFARVFKGNWNGKVVAVKVINEGQEEETTEKFREFRREVMLMSGLQHPNIVSLRGICLKPLCLVADKPMNWPLRIKIAMDIAKGMEFLHNSTPPVVHRDLKSPNILLGWSKHQVVAKVTDFGLSTRSNAGMRGRQVWNVSWLAPEIMKGHAYSTKVDVYSFGVILWELVVRQKPFSEFENSFKFDHQLEEEIKKGLRPTVPPGDIPADYMAIVEKCWADNPSSRPNFTEIIEMITKFEASYLTSGGETEMPVITEPLSASGTEQFDDESSSTGSTPLFSSVASERAPPNDDSATSLIFLDDVEEGGDDEDAEFDKKKSNENKSDKKEDEKIPDEDYKVLVYPMEVPVTMYYFDSVRHKFNAPTAPGSIQCLMTIYIKGAPQIWAGCGDGSIVIVDAVSRKQMSVIKHHNNRVYHMIGVNRSKQQEPQVWTASMDGTIVVIDINNINKPAKVIKVDKPLTCLLEVGDQVWAGSFDGGIRMFSKNSYKLKKTLKRENSAICCLCAPPVDDKIWIGTDKCILILDYKNQTIIQELEGHSSMVNGIKVDEYCFLTRLDKTIRVWSFEGEELHVLQGHSGKVFCLLAVGTYVISGSWDSSLFVWDSKTCKFLQEVTGYHNDGIGSLSIVKNEIWSGSWDRTMCVFALENKR